MYLQSVSLLLQVLPKSSDWQDFLHNENNKFRVCNLLADYFSSGDLTTDKTIYVTKEETCYIKEPNSERRELPEMYSCHREADHRYFLYIIRKYDAGLSTTQMSLKSDQCTDFSF